MNTDKSNGLTIWGAIGPNGQLVKSSVGTFKSEAKRWAIRRGNYEVVKLGTIPFPTVDEADPHEGEAEPMAAEAAPEKLKIDRGFFGRHRSRRTRGK